MREDEGGRGLLISRFFWRGGGEMDVCMYVFYVWGLIFCCGTPRAILNGSVRRVHCVQPRSSLVPLDADAVYVNHGHHIHERNPPSPSGLFLPSPLSISPNIESTHI